ncbi:MAG: hypothetical protein UR28_C0003G0073 [Candidatus Peregrinibacteria bacterium GW2011_GWF2_33_10]|nr:MAG: hypothetical protein UR28_C0003G0073 [Candidatus Peregrinibacteria bacterium GW2011_GWF2_33_10]OGJ44222.1 MAG: hypothetical protein A2263_04580 [Candidatus Peregrinibacteria bacterium RIFOXYA2_FULL_33_21]OGJ47211.1 MAG: hypothetical protein A2272_06400 [Candidatus Peregrinibacteria bacterium RIFOXYA12_FULL_33_12]OGJ49933.1 MAG: hypothetical protein A2307_00755 [Candidatus Peregrinibacteria bacterium RIFOXYB2_FULL_33_20]
MKHKTHSGVKKRIKVKKSKGKIKLYYQKAARNHLLCNKSKSQKSIPQKVAVSSAMARALKKMI